MDEAQWRELIRAAAVAGDGDALRALYARGQAMFGADAGRRWAEALSGLDAGAQTG